MRALYDFQFGKFSHKMQFTLIYLPFIVVILVSVFITDW